MRLASVAVAALLLAGCTEVAMQGDSRAWQVAQITDCGNAYGGHGYATTYPWRVPLDDPGCGDIAVMVVSVWDTYPLTGTFGTRQDVIDGYREAHATYSTYYDTVVWVEASQNLPGLAQWAQDAIPELNATVAAALGCDLVPWTVGDAQLTDDDIHYTPLGAALVAHRYSQLDDSQAC